MKPKCPVCGCDGTCHPHPLYHRVFDYKYNCGTKGMCAPWSSARLWLSARCYRAYLDRIKQTAKAAA